MNAVLWISQAVVALLSLAGGAYKVFMFDELAKVPTTAALPRVGWSALGVFEMVCGVLLVVPAVLKWMPELTPLAAAALAVEMLALAAMFARYSLQLAATNPFVWSAGTSLLAGVVAYGRYALQSAA